MIFKNKSITEIESLNPSLIRIFEAYLDINPETVSLDSLIVDRSLNFKERWELKKERYHDKNGWRFRGSSFLLKNKCPICGQQLYVSRQTSPSWTWAKMCGREGYLVYCPHCKRDINFYLTEMN